jgi:hypothetical protein
MAQIVKEHRHELEEEFDHGHGSGVIRTDASDPQTTLMQTHIPW